MGSTRMPSVVDIAVALTTARRRAVPLADFPGPLPNDLTTAYAAQEAAIALWPDEIAGWKVAMIAPNLMDRLAAPRLAGPVFRGNLRDEAENRGDLEVAVIPGGFAAVETEIAIVIGRDIPLRDRPWTEAELVARIGSMRLAMEIAGSPLATINQLGPPAVVSDFGNNTAIALGDAIAGWHDLPAQRLATAMRIDGVEVGRGSPAAVPGGPLQALQFLVEHLASRGRWLVRGDVVSTGATTGIHLVRPGQTAEARITNCPPLAVRITAAAPKAA